MHVTKKPDAAKKLKGRGEISQTTVDVESADDGLKSQCAWILPRSESKARVLSVDVHTAAGGFPGGC